MNYLIFINKIDVAIGAPWENNGTGIVYIYKGSRNGLMPQYTQRIFSNDASGFGVSISKGYDVDNNGCNGKYPTKMSFNIKPIIKQHLIFVKVIF